MVDMMVWDGLEGRVKVVISVPPAGKMRCRSWSWYRRIGDSSNVGPMMVGFETICIFGPTSAH